MRRSKTASLGMSTGAAGGGISVLHLPQRTVSPRRSKGMRFFCPHWGQGTTRPAIVEE